MPHSPVIAHADLRSQIARLERGGFERLDRSVLPFGDARIDTALPDGGLARSALHELVGVGPDTEHAAIPALMVAAIAGRLSGSVLWAYPRLSPFAPALAAVGLGPERVICVRADQAVLGVMEDALRAGCLAVVVGEVPGRLSLTASRRLQLAAEAAGVMALLLRFSRKHDDPVLCEPSAALTRWRVGPAPSPPALPHAPDVPGLGRARWRLRLVRVRGGEARSWLVDAPDADGWIAVAGDDAADRSRPARHIQAA